MHLKMLSLKESTFTVMFAKICYYPKFPVLFVSYNFAVLLRMDQYMLKILAYHY